MLECLILGDSIAAGISMNRPECAVHAKVGITSRKFVDSNITKELAAKTVIISLGSNDSENMKTLKELFTLREVVKADRVYWVLPANSAKKLEAVEIVADKFEDKTVKITELSKDGVHPTRRGYQTLVSQTR